MLYMLNGISFPWFWSFFTCYRPRSVLTTCMKLFEKYLATCGKEVSDDNKQWKHTKYTTNENLQKMKRFLNHVNSRASIFIMQLPSLYRAGITTNKMKWNESGFRPPLCTYRLNWARRTSWGWWDDWDDTVLQTQDSKFEPWRSEAEHATSRSRRLPTILTFTRRWGRNIFVSLKPPRPGTEPQTERQLC